MKKITEILKEKDFTISVELVPDRNGVDPDEIFQRIDSLKNSVDFVSVTKGAGGSLRGGTLPISYFSTKKYGLHTISHFVCRERTRQELENELVDMNYFGLKNVLALRGDPPAGSSEAWSGDYKYAYKLVKQIAWMNKGQYLPLHEGQEYRDGAKTDFCILVAGHPEDPTEDEIEHMKAKVDAGAEAIITQMVFSFDEYKTYVENLKKAGITIPVLAGIRPLISLKQAESAEKFFGLKVNDELKKGLEKGNKEFGLEYFSKMIRELKEYGAPGVHLFVLNDIDTAKELLAKVNP